MESISSYYYLFKYSLLYHYNRKYNNQFIYKTFMIAVPNEHVDKFAEQYTYEKHGKYTCSNYLLLKYPVTDFVSDKKAKFVKISAFIKNPKYRNENTNPFKFVINKFMKRYFKSAPLFYINERCIKKDDKVYFTEKDRVYTTSYSPGIFDISYDFYDDRNFSITKNALSISQFYILPNWQNVSMFGYVFKEYPILNKIFK
ncbi:MAG: hypothetical protein ACRCZI_03880 [Cetobacterium sp.]